MEEIRLVARLQGLQAVNRIATQHLQQHRRTQFQLCRRFHGNDGLDYWVFQNPAIEGIALHDDQPHELFGLILLVRVPKLTARTPSWNFELLRETLPDYVITPEDHRWQSVLNFLRRIAWTRCGRGFPDFAFGVVISDPPPPVTGRKLVTLAHDFSFAGATFLSSQIYARLKVQSSEPQEFSLRQNEDIVITNNNGILEITFIEEFSDLRKRVLATWICCRMARMSSNETERPWRLRCVLEAPNTAAAWCARHRIRRAIFITWTVEKPRMKSSDIANFYFLVALQGASLRYFISTAIAQLNLQTDREMFKRVAEITES